MTALTEDTRRLLAQSSTATLATQLFKRGLRNTFLLGVSRLNRDPVPVMVGEAYTLRYIPAREDLNGPGEYGERHPQRRAIEECPPGAVLVADCRRDVSAACGGDILLSRLAERGVGGMVTDGGMRDVANIAKLAMPVFIGAPAAPASFHRHAAVDANVPIACGGVPVYPGDVMVGDLDGVVVIPRHLADEVASDAAEQELLEGWILEEVRSGKGIPGLYPPDDATRARYEAWRRS
ncbi:MAG TPA: ribonuclease activity regulator RraA [Geminicoccaceae bacterium]|nr:ribonuclease activity regulator RraA [Geminicoccaceae bacterium]